MLLQGFFVIRVCPQLLFVEEELKLLFCDSGYSRSYFGEWSLDGVGGGERDLPILDFVDLEKVIHPSYNEGLVGVSLMDELGCVGNAIEFSFGRF